MRSLIWFRNDLRVTDNATLNAAVKASTEVIPVFVMDPAITGPRTAGAMSRPARSGRSSCWSRWPT